MEQEEKEVQKEREYELQGHRVDDPDVTPI